MLARCGTATSADRLAPLRRAPRAASTAALTAAAAARAQHPTVSDYARIVTTKWQVSLRLSAPSHVTRRSGRAMRPAVLRLTARASLHAAVTDVPALNVAAG